MDPKQTVEISQVQLVAVVMHLQDLSNTKLAAFKEAEEISRGNPKSGELYEKYISASQDFFCVNRLIQDLWEKIEDKI